MAKILFIDNPLRMEHYKHNLEAAGFLVQLMDPLDRGSAREMSDFQRALDTGKYDVVIFEPQCFRHVKELVALAEMLTRAGVQIVVLSTEQVNRQYPSVRKLNATFCNKSHTYPRQLVGVVKYLMSER